MGAAGYHLGSIDTLIRLRDHGVTPDFIRELSAQNVKNLSANELQRIRDHGVNSKLHFANSESSASDPQPSQNHS